MPFRKANFIINKSSVSRKIFKVILDNNGDLYFSFTYCQTKNYLSGYATFKAGQAEMEFNPTIDGKASEIPLKLSYHQDGQMHFKVIDTNRIDMPKSYKLAEVKTTPFNELSGEHFLTIEIEGLDHFEVDKKVKKKNEYNRIFAVDEDFIRYKFIFAGNVNPEQMIKNHSPVDIIEIARDSEPNPLFIAVQLQVFKDSIKKNAKPDDLMLMAICGFRKEDNLPEKDMKFLYLQAR